MKYYNFKRYKLSTLLKKVNFDRINFTKVAKYLDLRGYRNNFNRYKINFTRNKFNKITKYFNYRRYNFSAFYRIIKLPRQKNILIYFFSFIFISIFIYLSIPHFFNYNKSNISKLICKDFKVSCLIKGEIDYTFFPTPRIEISNFLIKDFSGQKKALAQIENTSITLPLKDLYNKEKFIYNNLKFKNVEVNINLKNYKEYKDFFKKHLSSKKINLNKASINLFDGKKNVATINSATVKYRFNKNRTKASVKGNFLNDKIIINFDNDASKNEIKKTFQLKLVNSKILTKIEALSNNDITSGNILLKKDRNKVVGIFDYINNQIVFKNANLRNGFLDGKFTGVINFLPYFNFNLDVNLNTVNFSRLYNYLTSLNKQERTKLFAINKKFNGEIDLNVNKIYSKHTFINNLESQIKFINGDILVERLLLNLKKLGAADVTGIIKSDEKFTIFKFENNVFLDNLKTFYNRFGIHNKEKNPYNLFLSGYLDLEKFILHLDEISGDKKFEEEDILFFVKEFNDIVLYEDFKSFFSFVKLKDFIRSISEEVN